MRPALLGCSVAVASTVWLGAGLARVEMEIEYADASDRGFFDQTPVEPLTSNPGLTLGEQRRLAFERALEIWARALQSRVPVRIEATFDPFPELPCEETAAVLGAARAQSAFAGFAGAPRADVYYPSPLADKLAGVDLDPSESDITALFNPRLDDGRCLGGLGWNYDFEAGTGQADFVNTVLHELAHGLGFASLVDEVSGEAGSGISVFETLMFDNELNKTWEQMSAAERAFSITNPFGLVWLGERVTNAAPRLLSPGKPTLVIEDEEPIVLLAEPSFGPFIDEEEREGALLYLAPDIVCDIPQPFGGGDAIVLLEAGGCADLAGQIRIVQELGAVAVLSRAELPGAPPRSVDAPGPGVLIPALALTQQRFDALVERLASGENLRASLSTTPGAIGTDALGRVLLNATDPVQVGSSASHWDASLRKAGSDDSVAHNLLMEPAAGGALENAVNDLSVQLLQDIGWGEAVCGDGVVDAGEECDHAIGNSDLVADACRLDCLLPGCGDGVVDSGEQCDGGSECRPDCTAVGRQPIDRGDAGGFIPPPRADSGSTSDAGGTPIATQPDAGAEARSVSSGCSCRLTTSESAASWFVAMLAGSMLWRRKAQRGRK